MGFRVEGLGLLFLYHVPQYPLLIIEAATLCFGDGGGGVEVRGFGLMGLRANRSQTFNAKRGTLFPCIPKSTVR